MKPMNLPYASVTVLLLLLAATALGVLAEAHDPRECVCPEPPPCPELVCSDGSVPTPLSSLSADSGVGESVQKSPAPNQQAIEKALLLIEKAEATLEEQAVE